MRLFVIHTVTHKGFKASSSQYEREGGIGRERQRQREGDGEKKREGER